MAKIKIGFIGSGRMGQMAHLRNYVTIDDCEVVALAEIRQETGKLVAQRYGIPKVYFDHRQMIDKEELDGIVVSQPFSFHAELLPDLYPLVKYMFTEKPLALTLNAARTLADAAAKNNCTHMVGYHKRSDPASVYAKLTINNWLQSNEMGNLKYVRITMPPGDWIVNGFTGLVNAGEQQPMFKMEAPLQDFDPEIADQAEKYEHFVNFYIHQVNLMRYLLGESYEITYVQKSGVLLAIQSNSGVAGIIEMTPYRTTIEWEENALIAFEKGYITLRLPAPMAINRAGTVEIYADPGNGETPKRIFPTLPWVDAMSQQAINFINVCNGQMKPPCDVMEAVEDLKIARDYIKFWKES